MKIQYSTFDDTDLVKKFLDNQPEAFSELMNRYYKKVFISNHCKVKDKDIAKDITQDAFLKAIIAIRNGKYSSQGTLLAWLNTLASNLCKDYFRKVNEESHVRVFFGDILTLQEKYHEALITEAEGEKDVYNEELGNTLKKLVAKLPKEQQEVILLRFYQDLSFKEIAMLTEVNINTSLARRRYAIINLKKMVKQRPDLL